MAHDPLLLYFTSGTTAQPKLVLHSHESYPVGHLSTMYWIGLQPGDVHWNISSPGWAKHAWSCFFAPWNAGATVFVFNYERFSAKAAFDVIQRCGVTSLCAPPTVWRMMIQEDLAAWKLPLRELVGAGEPLNPEVIEQVERAWGIRIRDGFGQTETTAQIGNTPGQLLKPGSMGRPLPGYHIALLDIDDQPRRRGRDRGQARARTGRPDARLRGRAREDRRGDARPATITPATPPRATPTATISTSAATTTCSSRPTTASARSSWKACWSNTTAVLEAAIVPSPDALRLSVPKAFITLRAGVEPSNAVAQSIFAFARAQAGAVQADPPHRISRAAEDDFRQDPPRRTAQAGERARRRQSRPRPSTARTTRAPEPFSPTFFTS